MNVLPTGKKPSFQRVTSASSASSDRTARANSSPSDEERIEQCGSGHGTSSIVPYFSNSGAWSVGRPQVTDRRSIHAK